MNLISSDLSLLVVSRTVLSYAGLSPDASLAPWLAGRWSLVADSLSCPSSLALARTPLPAGADETPLVGLQFNQLLHFLSRILPASVSVFLLLQQVERSLQTRCVTVSIVEDTFFHEHIMSWTVCLDEHPLFSDVKVFKGLVM